jgi:hypothetical protein
MRNDSHDVVLSRFLGINDRGVARGCNLRHKQWRRLYFYKTEGKSWGW